MTIGTTRITHGMMPCMNAPQPIPSNPIQFLRYLHRRRFSDREIAAILNDPPLYLLHQHAHAESPLRLLDLPQTDRHWTRRMVQWTRCKLGLKGHRKTRRDIKHPGQTRTIARRTYASRWVSLGLDLYPAQVDILDALCDGPQTMREIMGRSGRSKWPLLDGGRSAVAAIIESGTVVIVGSVSEHGRVVRQYALAEGVRPTHTRRRLTGVEQRLKSLGLIEDMASSLPSLTSATCTSADENIFHCEDN